MKRVRLVELGGAATGVRSVGRLLLVLTALTLSQCESNTGPPVESAGTVTYRLVSPNGAEGGLLAAFSSDEIRSVGEGDAVRQVVTTSAGGTVWVAVVHRFGAEGLSFDLEVDNVGAPPQPTLVEVVGPDDVRRSLSGYSLEIAP